MHAYIHASINTYKWLKCLYLLFKIKLLPFQKTCLSNNIFLCWHIHRFQYRYKYTVKNLNIFYFVKKKIFPIYLLIFYCCWNCIFTNFVAGIFFVLLFFIVWLFWCIVIFYFDICNNDNNDNINKYLTFENLI